MNYEELVKALRSASTVSTAWEKLMHDAAAAIEALQAQLPKRGEWIYSGEQDDGHNYYCHCSVCGAGDIHAIKGTVPYCWRCGAKMTEVQDDKV